jgi:hypothetical protein
MPLDPLIDDYSYRQLFLSERIRSLQVDMDLIDRRDIFEGLDHIILSSSCPRKIEVRFTHNLLLKALAISKGGVVDFGEVD